MKATRRPVLRWRAEQDDARESMTRRPDTLAVEEPLQIRVLERGVAHTLTVTMRTPGDDFDLVAGWLVSEGSVSRSTDISLMRYCADIEHLNTVEVLLDEGVTPPRQRAFATTSACGVCGADTVEDVSARRLLPPAPLPSPRGSHPTIDLAVLAGLPDTLREAQRVFDRTGGLHAAGLFAADGTVISVREDVGRHNAVDKVIGDSLRRDALPLHSAILQVSGRASFELVQKAAMAGIGVLTAVSAPSSLAVDLAQEAGIALVGFSRGASLNVYTHPERLGVDAHSTER